MIAQKETLLHKNDGADIKSAGLRDNKTRPFSLAGEGETDKQLARHAWHLSTI